MAKRSVRAVIIAAYLRITNPRVSYDKLQKRLIKYGKINKKPYKLPHINKKGVKINEVHIGNIQTFCFNQGLGGKDCAIIYFHGGGYVRMPRISHIRFLIRLAKASGLTVYAPIYPKAPNFTASYTYESIYKLYEELSKCYSKIILMGDSSGGGLALGLSLMLSKKGAHPEKTLLLSPWVDVSLTNPKIPEYEKADPLIWCENARMTGLSWAGELSVTDPLISPIYDELSSLKRVCIFAGTRELLYPDLILLHQKLAEQGVDHKWISADGMNHVYPIYPIPEAKKALKQIIQFIEGDMNESSY